MVIQLALNLGPAFAATPATDVFYRILSGASTVRLARTNAGVRGDANGCFSADVDVDVGWHPCRVVWDDGGSTNAPTLSVSEPITKPPTTLAAEPPGETPWTSTITAEGSPVADVDVWVTTTANPIAGVVDSKRTNSSGEATFLLGRGQSYYLHAQKDGLVSIVAQPFTVPAD